MSGVKRLLLASLCVFAAVGCGGSGSNPVLPTLPGTYEGTWVNVNDPTDVGTSTWVIDMDGTISGTDIDGSDDSSYSVAGDVDNAGNVTATTTLTGSEETNSLTGRLQFNAQSKLTGNLVWGSVPPLTYRYTFTRVTGG